MSETTPLIKAALNLRVGAGFDVYQRGNRKPENNKTPVWAFRDVKTHREITAYYFSVRSGSKVYPLYTVLM